MAGRVDPRALHYRRLSATAPRPLLPRRERLFFALSLITFAMASFYAAVVTLTRVTPELARGQNLTIPGVTDIFQNIGPLSVVKPSEESSFNRRINVLIIGVDKRPIGEGYTDPASIAASAVANDANSGAPYNTDTIMIATMDPVSKTISALSFPRDMTINLKLPNGFVYENRINASYAQAILASGWRVGDDPNKGIRIGAEALAADITRNFGIQIDRWVWMDFKGVEKLIDAIGGIEIDIPQELAVYDFYYTDDDETNAHYETFTPGKNKLNGYRAVAFGRYRNDSDLNRVKRQQLVLSTSLHEVFARGLLNNNPRELWDAYNTVVRHNIPFTEVVSYLPLLKDTGGQISLYSLGDPVNGVETMIPFTEPVTGAAYLHWNPDNVRYWINQTFTKSRYAKSTVEIENAAGPAGVVRAESLARFLQFDRGFPTVHLAPDVAAQPTTTIVLYSEQRRAMAEDIAKWVGIPTSAITVEKRTLNSQPDVLIRLGPDFKAPIY